MRSIALSGRYLSVIYLSERVAAAIIASSVMTTLWWASYLSRSPRSISTVSSTEGSSTCTGVKRLSKAASFSIYLRYSSSVVAPIVCSSPRASMGFNMFAASMLPSDVEPAPTRLCISSMNRIMLPFSFMELMAFLRRSSKSPLYLEPATMLARSSENTTLPFKSSGTWLLTIAWARPSTTADLPTPGSPMSTGLFLVRRESTWIILSISFFLPITGSILPSRAFCVRLVPYWSSSALIFSLLSLFWGCLRCLAGWATFSSKNHTGMAEISPSSSSGSDVSPPVRAISSLEASMLMLTPTARSMRMARHSGDSMTACMRCSVPTRASSPPYSIARSAARSNMCLVRGV